MTVTGTTADATDEITESAKPKSEYQELNFNIAQRCLIAPEFKKCREALTGPLKTLTNVVIILLF